MDICGHYILTGSGDLVKAPIEYTDEQLEPIGRSARWTVRDVESATKMIAAVAARRDVSPAGRLVAASVAKGLMRRVDERRALPYDGKTKKGR